MRETTEVGKLKEGRFVTSLRDEELTPEEMEFVRRTAKKVGIKPKRSNPLRTLIGLVLAGFFLIWMGGSTLIYLESTPHLVIGIIGVLFLIAAFVYLIYILYIGGATIIERISGREKPEGCCIIATCALPSQHPDLQYLRHFRDEVLKPTKSGRLIVYLYYALGSPISLMVLSSKQVKQIVRRKFIPFWIKICKEWEKQKRRDGG